MKKIQQLFSSIFSLVLFFFLVSGFCGSVYAIAAGGDGSGGGTGSGGNNAEPLTLVSSTPASGSTDVATSTVISLEFSKNVAYATVKEGNIKAVTLWTGGTQVPAEVTMADDQIQPDQRNFISVTPKEPLKEGTEYRVKVDTSLTSKSGNLLTAPAEVVFTTVGNNANTNSTNETQQNNATNNEMQNSSSSNSSLLIAVGALFAVLIGIVVYVLIKRKNA
jgi:hypothetical protein